MCRLASADAHQRRHSRSKLPCCNVSCTMVAPHGLTRPLDLADKFLATDLHHVVKGDERIFRLRAVAQEAVAFVFDVMLDPAIGVDDKPALRPGPAMHID